MAPKRKRQIKTVEQNKSPNLSGGLAASSRRSRRLRGAEVEYGANALDEIEKERRSRSRSRSVTPFIDHAFKTGPSIELTKIPSDAPPICPSSGAPLSVNRSDGSPRRVCIDFDDSGANDSFGTSAERSLGERTKRRSSAAFGQIVGEKRTSGDGETPKLLLSETYDSDKQNGRKMREEDDGEVEEEEKDDEEEKEDDEDELEENGGEDEPFSEDEQIDEGMEEKREIVEKGTDDVEEVPGDDKMVKKRLDEVQNDGEQIGDSDEEDAEEGEDNEKEEETDEKEEDNNKEREEEEEEDVEEEEQGEESGYEQDIEDPEMVQQRRRNLPKSALDDKFFSLAEMNAFLDAEDKKEEEKGRRINGRNLGQIENADEMEQLINSYEQANLQPRDWALSGEAKAEERPKDALLEQFVDTDYRMAAPPMIDAERTAQLEAIITKRIKEELFDDVVRKVRVNESLQPAAPQRNATAVVGTTEQKVRKSLAEVYGDKFSAGLNDDGEGNEENPHKLDPTVEAIKNDLDALFLKLDALNHFQFRPQPIHEEVKIVNNMPSLHMEEVGPQAMVGPEVNLLAPEEVRRRVKNAPKAADERTETDRKRERRQKKKKQRILASIGAMNGEGTSGGGEATEGAKKRKVRRVKVDFAEQMHKLAQNEGQQQLKKKRKRKVLGDNGEEKKKRKKKTTGVGEKQ